MAAQHAARVPGGWWRPPRLRSNEPDEHRRATWLELFYDLVYVVAVAALADGLVHHPTPRGLAAFLALFVPVWWSWAGVTFYNDRFDTDDLGHRMLTLLQMVGVVGLAVFAAHGLDEGGRGFALAYAALRFVLVFMYMRAGRHVPIARGLTRRYAQGFAIAATIWAASALAPAPWRYAMWAAALAIDFGTPLTARRHQAVLPVSRSHLPERIGLFTIIVLGEGVASLVRGGEESASALGALAAASLGLVLAFSIWWVYFENLDESVVRRTRVAGQVWFYAHLPLALGITASAAGVHGVVSHPDAPLAAGARWILAGGVALALTSLAVIHLTTRRQHARSGASRGLLRLASAGGALVLGAVSASWPAAGLAFALAALGAAQIVSDPPGRDPATTHAG